ncbi:MAG: glycosyltransferase family 4 protein [Chlorobiaceae bacterium]|nr:glycosyltransferase family 4 protein [Chlorobiaceae bacterium]
MKASNSAHHAENSVKNDLVFIHLLNDSSGSPLVLNETIRAVRSLNLQIKLYIGSHGDGILSGCGIPVTRYWYRRSSGSRLLTLFTYFTSQVILFFKLMTDRSISRNALIYVNTLLPFGAALYGKMTGRKVIYHIHEISITPRPFKYLLTTITRITSCFNIYVSDNHMKALYIPGVPARRVYNSLDADFVERSVISTYAHRYERYFNILMIASLRDYKGVPELIALAELLHGNSDIRIDLVVNNDAMEIKQYFAGRNLPSNVTVHSRTKDTAAFYGRANLVLNLSRVDEWVETFGLTILESISFGIPVIVPPVGGPTELISDGVEGFWVDSRNIDLLKEQVLLLFQNKELALKMSADCRKRAMDFTPECFAENIRKVIAQIS